MNNKTVLLIWISAVVIGAMIGISIPRAEATHQDKCPFALCAIFDILEHTLEEEQKQTALLDHMDCMQYHNFYGSHCGKPLNYTGVVNP